MFLSIFSRPLLLLLAIPYMLCANELFTQWCTEEKTVLHQAKDENKVILLAFTGADFCPWSQKMIEEVLSSALFVKKMQSEAILWHFSLHTESSAKEDHMRHQYKIEECPTLLVLDPQGREFARFGYLPYDALSFADHLCESITDFKEICSALKEPLHSGEASKWQELYAKSKQFSSADFRKCVLERGIQEDPGTDFLIEKYVFLLEKNTLKDRSVQTCRQMLLQKDPDNRFGTFFKIAMADFHKLSAKSSNKRPQKILRPLLHYLKRFEDKDKEHAWKAQMAIANYLFSQHINESALEFAKKAEKNVPDPFKKDIAERIAYIHSH